MSFHLHYSPIALPLIAGKRKILVGHCSVMYVRKLTGFTANIVISPYDRIRYSCLADTMKSFLHICPFHRRIILCQISHLEHGIISYVGTTSPLANRRPPDIAPDKSAYPAIPQKYLPDRKWCKKLKKTPPKKSAPITDNILIIFSSD